MNCRPTIQLASGTYFDFERPLLGPEALSDIAHALSNLCRFTGHTSQFYSVAEHSVHVSHLVPPAMALVALMHDAPEAFIGDVAKPLKELLPDYKRIEDRIEAAVFAHFNLPLPLPAAVKEADRVMLATEQAQAMHSADIWRHTHGKKAAQIKLHFWSPDEAFRQFIWRFRDLQPLPYRHPATSIGE